MSGLTALQALRDVADVQPGQHVLVIGAAGGVGTFAVQIAKAFGAQVTAVCSASKLDLARSLGADDAINYRGRVSPMGLDAGMSSLTLPGAAHCPAPARSAPAGALVIVGGDGGGRWTGGFFRGMFRAPLLSPSWAKAPRTDFQGAAGRPPRPRRPHRDRQGHTSGWPDLPAGRAPTPFATWSRDTRGARSSSASRSVRPRRDGSDVPEAGAVDVVRVDDDLAQDPPAVMPRSSWRRSPQRRRTP